MKLYIYRTKKEQAVCKYEIIFCKMNNNYSSSGKAGDKNPKVFK